MPTHLKLLSTLILSATLVTSGCSLFERAVYRPDINQGNYLENTSVSRLQIGMSQEQVLYILGTPMLQDSLGSNTWYYVFRQQPGHEKITQQTLKLTFDNAGTLVDMQQDTPPQK